jgi:hypothetical protein
MSAARRGRAGPPAAQAPLWTNADRRALGYVRLQHARSSRFAAHAELIERLCAARGLGLSELACDVEGATGSLNAHPGLTWALDRLAAGGAGAFVVPRLDHLTGAFGDCSQVVRWFRSRGLTLIVPERDLQPRVDAGPEPVVRSSNRFAGVGPRSWAVEMLRLEARRTLASYALTRAYE